MAPSPHYDEVEPGDELNPLRRVPTREQVRAFADVTSLDMGRFLSDEGGRAEGLQGMIVPSTLSMAFLSQFLTDWAGPKGHLRKLELNFRRMVEPGDHLECRALVIDKTVVNGEGWVQVDVSIENQRGEKPVVGTAVVILPQRG